MWTKLAQNTVYIQLQYSGFPDDFRSYFFSQCFKHQSDKVIGAHQDGMKLCCRVHFRRYLQDNCLYFLNSSSSLSYKRTWHPHPFKMAIVRH